MCNVEFILTKFPMEKNVTTFMVVFCLMVLKVVVFKAYKEADIKLSNHFSIFWALCVLLVFSLVVIISLPMCQL
jgi:hypothetical protein